MKIWKHRTFSPCAFIGFLAILALAFTLTACGGDDGTPQTAKWVSVDEDGDTWTLTITENTGRLVAKQGDTYKLEVDSATDGNLKSEGKVQKNTSGKILLKPDNATDTFEVTTNGDELISVSGKVTFDNDSAYEFDTPYSLTPSSKPSGGSGKWTLVSNTIFGDNNINGIAYGNGKFVAVGSNGKMAYSTNGINWTAVSNSTFESYSNPYIWTITWGNGKFMAGGYDGKMAYSTDGINWTAATNSIFGINGIAWGNNKYVAVGASSGTSKIAYSADGISWTAVADTKLTTATNGIAWGNNKFVAVASSNAGSTNTAASSPDGITWTAVEGVTNHMNDIVWGGNKFVAVGSTRILYSANGTTWTQASGGLFALEAIAWGGNRFVAGGESGVVFTSPDGITWTKMADNVLGVLGTVGSISIGYDIKDIAYGNNKFVAVGEDGKMAYWQP